MKDKIMIPKDVKIETYLEIHSTSNRGDIDNYIKQVFDSANKIIWYDDKQVTRCDILLRRKCKEPLLFFKINPMENIFEA